MRSKININPEQTTVINAHGDCSNKCRGSEARVLINIATMAAYVQHMHSLQAANYRLASDLANTK